MPNKVNVHTRKCNQPQRPCGESVVKVMEEVTLWWILKAWGLLRRRSRIQRVGLSSREENSSTRVSRLLVLKAEEKPRNNWQTQEFHMCGEKSRRCWCGSGPEPHCETETTHAKIWPFIQMMNCVNIYIWNWVGSYSDYITETAWTRQPCRVHLCKARPLQVKF